MGHEAELWILMSSNSDVFLSCLSSLVNSDKKYKNEHVATVFLIYEMRILEIHDV